MKSLTLLNPETITVLDPACGSGHILVETYDVLKAIYLERGYRMRDIPRLILEKNLYGLDIDERAAQLAGFALLMKASADDRRLLDNPPKLNVLALQESKGLDADELTQALSGLLTPSLEFALRAGQDPSKFAPGEFVATLNRPTITSLIDTFAHALTFGSLIQIPPDLNAQLPAMNAGLQLAIQSGDLLAQAAALNLLPLVRQARILGMQFDAVVANPPYMGGKGMNPALRVFAKREFPDSKADLFAMFIERGFEWCKPNGFNSMVTMQSWMFLSSYEAMRENLLQKRTLSCMVHMGNGVMGIAFGTAATIFLNQHLNDYAGSFSYCDNDNLNDDGIPAQFPVENERLKIAKPDDFKKISGSPIVFFVGLSVFNVFENFQKIGDYGSTGSGLQTSDNDRFLRQWFEICYSKFGNGYRSRIEAKNSEKKWFPHKKGGAFKKWYGNDDFVLNWENDGQELFEFATGLYGSPTRIIKNTERYFQNGITWSHTTSSFFSARIMETGTIFNVEAPSLFDVENEIFLPFLCSKVCQFLIGITNPTMHFVSGSVAALPFNKEKILPFKNEISKICQSAIEISKTDWNNYETSWDFTENPLIRQKQNTPSATISLVIPARMPESSHRDVNLSGGTPAQSSICADVTLPSMALDSGIPAGMTAFSPVGYASRTIACEPHHSEKVRDAYPTLEASYQQWQTQNRADIVEMQRLEEENNRLFIEASGLQDELSPEVPEDQITLARADREKDCQRLISYAIGCIMGRYSLDRSGLIYAHAGNVDFNKIYYGTDTPPFEKRGAGGDFTTHCGGKWKLQSRARANPP